MRKKLSTIIGAAIVLFVILNVQFGMVAPQYIKGSEGHKLDVMKMAEPQCAVEKVESEIELTGTSYCLGEQGQWGGPDILMLIEGLFVLLAGKLELPQNRGWAKRMRKIGVVIGSVLCILAVIDRLGWLPASANSDSLADLIPFAVDGWIVQILLAGLGVMLIRGPKYWEAEAIVQTRERNERKQEKAGRFRDSFYSADKHSKKQLDRITRTSLLKNDMSMATKQRRSNLLVMATCPYCQGGGCKKCKEFGVF